MKSSDWRRWVIDRYCELPRNIRKPLWRFWHRILLRFDKDRRSTFLNYGYLGTSGDADLLPGLSDRHGILLYERVVRGTSLEDHQVLEVGCGRGGGAAWLANQHRPARYIGLDISEEVVTFCRNEHQVPNLSFVCGEAEDLPFPDNTFDVLVNVESSRCYGHLDRFFSEVRRVLKPGGQFCYADMMRPDDVPRIRKYLTDQGFQKVMEEDLTSGVVRALQDDSENRRQLINGYVPAFFRSAFYEFAGVEGSRRFEIFRSGEMEYRCFELKAPKMTNHEKSAVHHRV